MTEIRISADEIRSWLAEPESEDYMRGWHEGLLTSWRMMVKQCRGAIEWARREDLPGHEERIVAYEMIIAGREQDIAYIEQSLGL
jgi:hypothetical protein